MQLEVRCQRHASRKNSAQMPNFFDENAWSVLSRVSLKTPPAAPSCGLPREEIVPITPALMPYTKDLVRGDICAFTTGYFVFLAETAVSVKSIVHFMPGMRVIVATDPAYFSVFNRWVNSRRYTIYYSSMIVVGVGSRVKRPTCTKDRSRQNVTPCCPAG